MKTLLLSFSLLLIVSCTPEVKDLPKPASNISASDGTVDAEIKAIDEELSASGQIASSLTYTMENGASIVVHAHLNAKGKVLKIEEVFNDGQGSSPGKRIFYLQEDHLMASSERFEDLSKANEPQFVERLSYYDKKGEVSKTLEKRVQYEEDLEGVQFTVVNKHKLDMSRAKRALNQEGEFETTFQGFVETQGLRYLVIGSNKSGYTSAVRINNEDDFIRFISQNQQKFLNRKVKISFEHVVDNTGFEYQSYIQGSFSD